jgi:endonuclease YncB( thermonuclease family)
LLLLVLAGPALAGPAQQLPAAGTAVVKAVMSGDTVILGDGRTLRLSGIQAPRIVQSRARAHTWPLAAEARAALSQLVLGRTVTLYIAGARQDRHDRLLAQLVRDDGLWLQGELLSRGWARAYVSPDLRDFGAEMYALEQAAREAHRGIWDNRFYAVRDPNTLNHDFDSFQLVEGQVLSVSFGKGQLYLNFGPNWRTDFSVRVPRRSLKPFRQLHGDPHQLQGQRVRVRGWLYRHSGPEIEITVPEQLEVLETAPKP